MQLWDGSAVIDVYVDGELKAENASTKAAPTRGEAYIMSDLTAGKHTIKIVLKSGTLNVDALNTIGERLAGADGAVTEILTELPTLEYYVTGSGVGDLPAEVEVKLADGTTETKSVEWNGDTNALDANAYKSASISGTVKDAVNALGEPLTVSVQITEVIPGDTVYFIDTVAGDPTSVTGGTTETYELYKKALGEKTTSSTRSRPATTPGALLTPTQVPRVTPALPTRQLPVSTARTTRRARH